MTSKRHVFDPLADNSHPRWMVLGHGSEITSIDVRNAFSYTLKAVEYLGTANETKKLNRALVASEPAGGIVRRVLGDELELN